MRKDVQVPRGQHSSATVTSCLLWHCATKIELGNRRLQTTVLEMKYTGNEKCFLRVLIWKVQGSHERNG